jgi:hypothetical protein
VSRAVVSEVVLTQRSRTLFCTELPCASRDRHRPATESSGRRPFPASAAGHEIGLDHALKVETRVRTPLGLPGETRRRRFRLHPGQGADAGLRTTPNHTSTEQSRMGRLSLIPYCPADERPRMARSLTTSRCAVSKPWSR